jgi:hypothetical protein
MSQLDPVHTPTFYFLKIHLNINENATVSKEGASGTVILIINHGVRGVKLG